MLRVRRFLCALSQGMKHGFIIMNQNPKDNPWKGDTHPLLPRKKVQVGTLCQRTYADIVL
jgi:hypothetical protein